MATPDIDAEIDRLYQLPLDEFTPARNALAKQLERATIRDLEKPNIAAWAINQLYWKERSAYTHLIHAAEQLRAEHRKLLSGKPSAIREAEQAHRDAIRTATAKIKDLLKASSHAASDGTLAAVQETLESLPSDDPPGRLTRPLKPLGFEALAGIPTTARAPGQGRAPARPSSGSRHTSGPSALKLVKSPADQQREREEAKRREKEDRERKERQRQAEKELKAAEAAMLRAEDAVKQAEKTLADLRSKRDEAVSEYQRARLRARE